MNDAQANALSMVQTRLHRLDGAVEQNVTRTARDYLAVDFRLIFPSAPLVYDSYRGEDGDTRSSLIINHSCRVDSLVLRLPPLPAEDVQYADTYTGVFSMAHDCSSNFYIDSHVGVESEGGDVVSLWPHVYFRPHSPNGDISPELSLGFIRCVFHQYCERYEGGV